VITANVNESVLLREVHTPKDFAAFCVMEQSHEVIISAPPAIQRNMPFEVTIEVGTPEIHANTRDHFIEWIEVYSGSSFILRVNLSESLSVPKITVPLTIRNTSTMLRVWLQCNRHGIWEGSREISVV
jgi:superoxide reductase